MFYTKENYEYLLSIIEEYNIYDFKTLTLKYNELTGSNKTYNAIKGCMNYFSFSMKRYKINKILELHNLGLTNQQIADIVGSSKNHVSYMANKYGSCKMKKRKKGFWKNKTFKYRIRMFLEKNNYNLNAVGSDLRMTFTTLVKALKLHGLYDEWRENAVIKDGTKTEKCIEYLKKYPDAKISKIAKAVGCDPKTVRKAREKLNKII